MRRSGRAVALQFTQRVHQGRERVVAQDEVGRKIPIVHGVYADGSLEAERIARQAVAGIIAKRAGSGAASARLAAPHARPGAGTACLQTPLGPAKREPARLSRWLPSPGSGTIPLH